MPVNLSPGIRIQEEAPQTRTIDGVPTAVLLGLGVTERGPEAVTQINSFEDYLQLFGGHTLNSDLTPQVQAYFDEGGSQAYIKRVLHYTDITNPATKQGAKGTVTLQSAVGAPGAGSITGTVAGPWTLADGDTLDFSVNGGGTDTATFNADAALVTGSNTGTFTLTDGQTLVVEIDNGAAQTISFLTSEFSDISNATTAEVVAVINAKISGARATVSANAVRITSDTLGTSSDVTVTGGTATATLGLTGATDAGGGDVADITAVTAAEAKTLIEADVTGVTVSEATGGFLTVTSNTVGGSSAIQVEATSTADDEFGFDNAVHSGTTGAAADALVVNGKTIGAYTDDVLVRILAASSGVSTEFNLQVEADGVVVEGPYPNLSMVSTEARYALTIVNGTNGSNLVELAAPGTPLGLRPANGLSGAMTGGDDGITGLASSDFIGSTITNTGLRGFDTVADGRILIIPGQTAAAVQLAALTYCEDTRGDCFYIADIPLAQTAAQAVMFVKTTNALLNVSEFGATFFPAVKILNPNTAVYGDDTTITVYNCGFIAGVMARQDASRPGGIYQAAAGQEFGRFRTVQGLESEETLAERNRDLLYPARINPISLIGGLPTIDGTRTLRGNSNFPSTSERRAVIFIEQSIKEGIRFAQFRNNDAVLRSEVRRAITGFLVSQMRLGAFRSRTPNEAFNVDVSDQLNPASVVFAGQLIAKIGLATQRPADFINLIFTQDTRALDAEIAGA